MSGVASAQAPALRWKFEEGDKFYVEEKSKTKMTLEVLNMPIKQDINTVRTSQFTVKKKTDKGFLIEQKILGWTSEQKGGPGIGDDGLLDRVARKAKFTAEITPEGKIISFKGYKEFIDLLEDENAEEARIFKTLITQDAIRSILELVFNVVPEEEATAETWKTKSSISMAGIGSQVIENTFKRDGQKDGFEQVDVKGKFSFKAPKEGAEGLPFKIVEIDLKSPGTKGTMLFDAKKGRLEKFTSSQKMSGSMTMDVQGQQITVELTADESRTIRVSGKNFRED
jgi:hypothetical protein